MNKDLLKKKLKELKEELCASYYVLCIKDEIKPYLIENVPVISEEQIKYLTKTTMDTGQHEICENVNSSPFRRMKETKSFISLPLKKEHRILASVFLGFNEIKLPDMEKIKEKIKPIEDFLIKNFKKKEKFFLNNSSQENSSLMKLNYRIRGGLIFGEEKKIVGIDPIMITDLYRKIDRACNTSPVTILGESGTGKELVAQALHYKGKRKTQKFISFNCANTKIDATARRTELFGCANKSFTGIDERKEGLFRSAHGATFFLDEVGSLDLETQGTLLKVLEYGEFIPYGEKEVAKVDVNIIVANNVDLRELVKSGLFREDLFYRLTKYVIEVPPLRKRGNLDVELLARYFLDKENERTRTSKIISNDAIKKLFGYHWPGNVRELKNVIDRAHTDVRTWSGSIEAKDIVFTNPFETKEEIIKLFPFPDGWNYEDMKKEIFCQAYNYKEKHGKKQKEIAKMLDMKESCFSKKLEKYGLR